MRVTKRIDIGLLQEQLKARGIPYRVLRVEPDDQGGWNLFDQNEVGEDVELPSSATSAIDAHTAPPIPEDPDWGTDEPANDFTQQIADVVRNFRYYLSRGVNGNPPPTAAENVGAIKLLIRVMLVLIKVVLLPKKMPPPPEINVAPIQEMMTLLAPEQPLMVVPEPPKLVPPPSPPESELRTAAPDEREV